MISPVRRAVHRVLQEVHDRHKELPSSLAEIRQTLNDDRNRALLDEIVTGTLRWQGALDHILAQVSSRPLIRVDSEILNLLRAAVYQLRYLDRVPPHAIVNDAVALTRTIGKRSAGTFVNAILRTLTTESCPASLPSLSSLSMNAETPIERGKALDYLTIALSHPRWLVERWLDRYGFDSARRWAEFNNQRAPIVLRVNMLRTSPGELTKQLAKCGIEVKPGYWSPCTLLVTHGNPLTAGLGEQGLYHVQGEASQLVSELVAAKPGSRVLDACASPGGKTVTIAGAMNGEGLLVAGDLRSKRLKLLSNTLARLVPHAAQIVQLDLRKPPPLRSVFDWVLLDAPCSGLGTLRSNPEIRWRCRPQDLVSRAAHQSIFLETTATTVAPGGRLVYSTCSTEPEENEDVVQQFLEIHDEFTLERPSNSRLAPLINPVGYLKTLPHRDNLEGFFAAVLKRKTS